jgi:hypothetical protein
VRDLESFGDPGCELVVREFRSRREADRVAGFESKRGASRLRVGRERFDARLFLK